MQRLLLIIAVITTLQANAQVVNIPDANFKNWLVNNSAINTNSDTEIQVSEASAFTGALQPIGQGILDWTGIEAFTSITSLTADFNDATSIDLSQNAALQTFSYEEAFQLTSVILPDPSNNSLTGISITDASGLTVLDPVPYPNLQYYVCDSCDLSSVDLSGAPSLIGVSVRSNPNLTFLSIKNGNNTNFSFYDSTNTPMLTCVEVDDISYAQVNFSSKDPANIFSLACAGPPSPTDFVFEVEILNVNIPFSIAVPAGQNISAYNYDINWGDGVIQTNRNSGATHSYSTTGVYEVRISGQFPAFFISQATSRPLLKSIKQWGAQQWTTMYRAFYDCDNMSIAATDSPDLSLCTSLEETFAFHDTFNDDISQWDISNVSNLSNTFYNARNFNQPLNNWNVSAVTDMSGLFWNAVSFDQDLSNWDTQNVTTLNYTFAGATSFNSDISTWDTSAVQSLRFTFIAATSFNQPLAGWNTSSVTDMENTFAGATVFNQPLNTWNVSNVASFFNMFNQTSAFNQDLHNWDVSGTFSINSMFKDATAFNGDVTTWNLQNLTGLGLAEVFNGAISFNQDISNWDVSGAQSLFATFFLASSFNQDISSWDTTNVTDMSFAFGRASSFDQNLGNWDVSNVTTMQSMFTLNSGMSDAAYSQTLEGWSTQTVQNNVSLDADAMYCTQGQNARNILINTFNWVITDGGLNTAMSCNTLNINSVEKMPEVLLFPNPARNYIEISGDFAFAKADLYNLQGQLVLTSSHNKISVVNLESGTYLIHIFTEEGKKASHKLIKY